MASKAIDTGSIQKINKEILFADLGTLPKTPQKVDDNNIEISENILSIRKNSNE